MRPKTKENEKNKEKEKAMKKNRISNLPVRIVEVALILTNPDLMKELVVGPSV